MQHFNPKKKHNYCYFFLNFSTFRTLKTVSMESAFEEFENIDILTDKEIFTKIWTQPRRILKYIHEKNYAKYSYLLLYLIGLGNILDNASMRNYGDRMSMISIIGIAVFGALLGWIGLYIYSGFISITGKWIGGKGNTNGIFGIIPYCYIPSIISLVFLFTEILIFGVESFKYYSFVIEENTTNFIIYYSLLILEGLFSLYSIVMLIIGVSEVQKFGIGKAILNIVLPILLVIPFILLIILFTK